MIYAYKSFSIIMIVFGTCLVLYPRWTPLTILGFILTIIGVTINFYN